MRDKTLFIIASFILMTSFSSSTKKVFVGNKGDIFKIIENVLQRKNIEVETSNYTEGSITTKSIKSTNLNHSTKKYYKINLTETNNFIEVSIKSFIVLTQNGIQSTRNSNQRDDHRLRKTIFRGIEYRLLKDKR